MTTSLWRDSAMGLQFQHIVGHLKFYRRVGHLSELSHGLAGLWSRRLWIGTVRP